MCQFGKIGISQELSITFWNAIHQIKGNHLLFKMKEKNNIQIRIFEIIMFLNSFSQLFFEHEYFHYPWMNIYKQNYQLFITP